METEDINPPKTWENIPFKEKFSFPNSFYMSLRDANLSERFINKIVAEIKIGTILRRWYYPFTDEEWKNTSMPKYCIAGYDMRGENFDNWSLTDTETKCYLAFRSEDEMFEFIENNRQLLLDYCMTEE